MRLDTLWQRPGRQAVELLQDATPRPVELRVLFEDDVDRREAEQRVAADGLYLGKPEKRGGHRVRDLVLDVLGRAAHPLGEDDLLVLADVGDGVHGHRVAGQPAEVPVEGRDHHAPKNKPSDEEQHDHLVLEAEAYELVDRI